MRLHPVEHPKSCAKAACRRPIGRPMRRPFWCRAGDPVPDQRPGHRVASPDSIGDASGLRCAEDGRLSPDNRWVSFTARIKPDLGRIVVAPADGLRPIPESAWLTIAETEPDDYEIWSPDGKTLYFTSSKDGYSCLWGQRIDASSRRPVGEAFAVQHFHGRLFFDHGRFSAAAGRIAIPLVEMTGNVWMMSRSGAQ